MNRSSEETFAGAFRLKLLWCVYCVFGARVLKWMLLPITAAMYPFLGAQRRNIKKYFKTLNAFGRSRGLRPVRACAYCVIYAYAAALVDRIAAASGLFDPSVIKFGGDFGKFKSVLASGRGVFVVGSHLGNIEILGGAEPEAHVNVFVDDWSGSVFRKFFLSKNRAKNVSYINVENITLGSFGRIDALLGGPNIMVLLADRLSASAPDRFFVRDFLGVECRFPKGAFALVSMTGADAFFADCVHVDGGYEVCLKYAGKGRPSGELATEYAGFLEERVGKSPYQWFNFFDFFGGNK